MKATHYCALFFVIITGISSAHAQDSAVRGHLKYQGGYFLSRGSDDGGRHELDARLNVEHSNHGFESIAHGQLIGYSSDFDDLEQFNRAVLPTDDDALVDLSSEIYSEDDTEAAIRMDRLSLGYKTESTQLKIGRQVVTLGNGLVFNVLDRLNPFAPLSIDKEYKRGSDMAFLGFIPADGDELQLFAVPRREQDSDDAHARVAHSSSSFAVRYRGRSEYLGVDYETLVMEHYDDAVYGAGFSFDALGAVVRCDAALTDSEGSGVENSFLLNIDRSAEFLGRNLYWFLEYFHNGFGLDQEDYSTPDLTTIERIQRGELFTIGKDYLGPGVRVEADPRLNLYLNLVHNLRDDSGVVQLRSVFDILQNLLFTLGINQPYGGAQSEYGARANVASGGKATALYSRVEFYF